MADKIIQQYEADEHVMIQLFAQWCANHEINANSLYEQAYPSQPQNTLLVKTIEETEKDSLHVDTETVLHVLQLFGNEELAFEVSKAALDILK